MLSTCHTQSRYYLYVNFDNVSERNKYYSLLIVVHITEISDEDSLKRMLIAD